MARVFDHSTLESLLKTPQYQLSMVFDSFHPCQNLQIYDDKRKKKKLDGLKICWVGDGNNVCNSLIYGCAKVGINVSIATPKEFQPLSKVVKESKNQLMLNLQTILKKP